MTIRKGSRKTTRRSHTPSEADVQRAVLRYLRMRGIACWRINVIGIPTPDGGFRANHDMVGMADIHCIPRVNGVGASVWLEIKAPGKKQTPHQKTFEERVLRAGGYYFVIRTVDEIVAVLDKLTLGNSTPPEV